jgi:hypothetical protein
MSVATVVREQSKGLRVATTVAEVKLDAGRGKMADEVVRTFAHESVCELLNHEEWIAAIQIEPAGVEFEMTATGSHFAFWDSPRSVAIGQ